MTHITFDLCRATLAASERPKRPTIACPECDGDGRTYHSTWGGNDPDVWTRPCRECGGTGKINAPAWQCDCCRKTQAPGALKVERYPSEFWCAECHAAEPPDPPMPALAPVPADTIDDDAAGAVVDARRVA